MWDSVGFNMLVLVLIVSNFVFTVEQVPDRPTSRQRYRQTGRVKQTDGLAY